MLLLLTDQPGLAQTVESLVMPGPVVRGHAETETECSACHKPFARSEQNALCRDCHDDVSDDIAAGRGFHGRSADVASNPCASCHTEHEGRSADIVGLDESAFDHAFTDFELIGKHLEAACDDCHEPDLKHRDAPGDCVDCHRNDDVHEGHLGDACADCHDPSDWLGVEFDHDTTDFPLLGKHRQNDCLDCHRDRTHQDTPTTCYGCHADDDFHDGRSGQQCENCHNPESWTDTSFNHARDTEFPLDGHHATLTCDDCHGPDPFSDDLDRACIGCHRDDDRHEGRNGDGCADCHSTGSWTESLFDHARDTDFVLLGSHRTADCAGCHVEPVFEAKPATDCWSCHREDDAHEGKLGERCDGCHDESAWEQAPLFEHDLTRFPLLGEHANVECESCHETQVFAGTEDACFSCHLEDDPHGETYEDDCASCHNPVAWDLWLFDHDARTDFVLDGAHADLPCGDCHRSSLDSVRRIGGRCADCHRADDVHDGEYGTDCGRCHSNSSFTEVRSLQ